MNEVQTFRRFPSVRCWIHHILQGKYSQNNKSLYTIFGQIKRVRVIGNITEKKEILNNQNMTDEDFFEEEDSKNVRIEFHLDDGTGLIRATLWSVNPENYKEYEKGDKIDIIGLIKNWKGFISISPEIIKKVNDPNFTLLCDLEIIKRIKNGDIKEIPEIDDEIFGINNNNIDEIDVNSLFQDDNPEKSEKIEELFLFIEEHTLNGEGVSFQQLKELLNISEEELKEHLKSLEIESRIYQSEDSVYQSY
ncbi:MAG: hypothetical protein KGD57_02770 [Candidatus Lokiarchaeota archaeon]|nr:hypothetical protein [Candidatus Lokiarchaeota archaeon]